MMDYVVENGELFAVAGETKAKVASGSIEIMIQRDESGVSTGIQIVYKDNYAYTPFGKQRVGDVSVSAENLDPAKVESIRTSFTEIFLGDYCVNQLRS